MSHRVNLDVFLFGIRGLKHRNASRGDTVRYRSKQCLKSLESKGSAWKGRSAFSYLNLHYVDCILVHSHAQLFSLQVFLQARLLILVFHHPPQPSGKCRILMRFTYVYFILPLSAIILIKYF